MSPREREVRQYATDLLSHLSVTTVPVDPVDEQPASIGTLQSLADELRTSLTMMAIRHAELTGRATASILSRAGRVEWVFFSRRLKGDPVPPATATLSLARDLPGLSGGETRSAAGSARAWLDGASASRSRGRRGRDGKLRAGADAAGGGWTTLT